MSRFLSLYSYAPCRNFSIGEPATSTATAGFKEKYQGECDTFAQNIHEYASDTLAMKDDGHFGSTEM